MRQVRAQSGTRGNAASAGQQAPRTDLGPEAKPDGLASSQTATPVHPPEHGSLGKSAITSLQGGIKHRATGGREEVIHRGDPMTLLTVSEVAHRLRVKTSWVYSHADMLGAFHLGKYLRFDWSLVVEQIERRT